MKKISVIVDEHSSMRRENKFLHAELEALRIEHHDAMRRLSTLQRELERTSQTKEVVNLCKLLLTGSLIPLVSVFLLYTLIDGSILGGSSGL